MNKHTAHFTDKLQWLEAVCLWLVLSAFWRTWHLSHNSKKRSCCFHWWWFEIFSWIFSGSQKTRQRVSFCDHTKIWCTQFSINFCSLGSHISQGHSQVRKGIQKGNWNDKQNETVVFWGTQKPGSSEFLEEKAEKNVVGIYLVIKSAGNVNRELFINSHSSRTKVHSMKLLLEVGLNKNKRKYMITLQTMDFWSLLPKKIKRQRVSVCSELI